MIIPVASGKGGTGKTTVASSLALSLGDNVQFLDCDAEEPNAHIFLKPVIKKTEKVCIPVPKVDETKCNYCGKCGQVCAYNALAVIQPTEGKKGHVLVFDHLCHGCGGCSYLCPQNAIEEVGKEIGIIETGYSGSIQFVHGKLHIVEAMAPPVIKRIKKSIDFKKTVIIDVPPGTSCPVVEAIKDSDFCILVTEPTPFGLNDLILAVKVLRKLAIPFGVVINRSDLGNHDTNEYCRKENIPVLMRIPFKKEIAKAFSKGEPLVKAFPEYKKDFQELFDKIKGNNSGS